MTMVEIDYDRIGELAASLDEHRVVAGCPYCACVAIWINDREFGHHVLSCVLIDNGLAA